jgi:hypothetical protein
LKETTGKLVKSRRNAQALAIAPGNKATELEALATMEGTPMKTRAANVRKEPPPAIAFITPAPNAAITNRTYAAMTPLWYWGIREQF